LYFSHLKIDVNYLAEAGSYNKLLSKLKLWRNNSEEPSRTRNWKKISMLKYLVWSL